MVWVVAHVAQLVGFRNRFLVMFQWAWSYLTFQSGARLVVASEDQKKRLERAEAKSLPQDSATPVAANTAVATRDGVEWHE